MDSLQYEKIAEVNGRGKAEFFKSFLEAQGIDVQLFEESIAQIAYVVAFAPVQLFVPRELAGKARRLLSTYEEFQLEHEDDDEEDES